MSVLQAVGGGLLVTGLTLSLGALIVATESRVPRVIATAYAALLVGVVLLLAGAWFALFAEVTA